MIVNMQLIVRSGSAGVCSCCAWGWHFAHVAIVHGVVVYSCCCCSHSQEWQFAHAVVHRDGSLLMLLIVVGIVVAHAVVHRNGSLLMQLLLSLLMADAVHFSGISQGQDFSLLLWILWAICAQM